MSNYNIEKICKELRWLKRQIGSKEIKYTDTALSGAVNCCYVFGIDYTDGTLYYKDINGNWALISTGTTVTPAPPTNSIQYNNAGAFGGSSNLLFDGLNLTLQGDLYLNNNKTIFFDGVIDASETMSFVSPYTNGIIAGAALKTVISNNSGNGYTIDNSTGTALFQVLGTGSLSYFSTPLKIGAYTLPNTDGTNGQVLETNGSGVLTWSPIVAPAGTLTGTTLASNVVNSSLTNFGIQSAPLNMGGNLINNVTNPVSPQDAATKYYVDNTVSGLTWKPPVQAFANTNIPLTGSTPLVIDGYTMLNGNSAILHSQTTTAQNGVYKIAITGGTYTLTLREVADLGYAYLVLDGTQYSYDAFLVSSLSPTIYTQFSGPTEYSFTTPLLQTGTTISINQATTSTNGYLSSTDWNTFNNKPISVFGRTGAVVAISGDYNTSLVTESGNLYFTNARAIASTLTGYTSGAGTISSSDSILQAIQKLNGNASALVTGVSSVSNSDASLTISPTTGAVIASINLGHANFFSTNQSATQLGIGTGSTTPSTLLQIVETSTASPRGILSDQYNTGTEGARVTMRKARGTFASPSVIVTGDSLGSWTASGHDGSNFVDSGKVIVTSIGTIGTGIVPSTMQLQTTNAAGTLVTGIKIDQAQNVSVSLLTSNGLVKTSGGAGQLSIAVPITDYQPTAVSNTIMGQSGANASIVSLAPVSGLYDIGAMINVTGGTVDVLSVQCSYKDENGSAQTINIKTGVTTSTGFRSIPPTTIWATAGTNITVLTILTTGTGTITYNIGAYIQRIS